MTDEKLKTLKSLTFKAESLLIEKKHLSDDLKGWSTEMTKKLHDFVGYFCSSEDFQLEESVKLAIQQILEKRMKIVSEAFDRLEIQ